VHESQTDRETEQTDRQDYYGNTALRTIVDRAVKLMTNHPTNIPDAAAFHNRFVIL